MRNISYTGLFSIVFILCTASSAYSNTNKSFMDSLTIVKEDTKVKFSSLSFLEGESVFMAQPNRSEITYSLEGAIAISPETKQKIDSAGGLLQILKDCLLPETFEKLSRVITLSVGVVMNQDCEILYDHSVSILSENVENITLSEAELKRLFEYARSLRFIYLYKPEGEFIYSFYCSNTAFKKE